MHCHLQLYTCNVTQCIFDGLSYTAYVYILAGSRDAELADARERMGGAQARVDALASEVDTLRYQGANYARVFAEHEQLTGRVEALQVRQLRVFSM